MSLDSTFPITYGTAGQVLLAELRCLLLWGTSLYAQHAMHERALEAMLEQEPDLVALQLQALISLACNGLGTGARRDEQIYKIIDEMNLEACWCEENNMEWLAGVPTRSRPDCERNRDVVLSTCTEPGRGLVFWAVNLLSNAVCTSASVGGKTEMDTLRDLGL